MNEQLKKQYLELLQQLGHLEYHRIVIDRKIKDIINQMDVIDKLLPILKEKPKDTK